MLKVHKAKSLNKGLLGSTSAGSGLKHVLVTGSRVQMVVKPGEETQCCIVSAAVKEAL